MQLEWQLRKKCFFSVREAAFTTNSLSCDAIRTESISGKKFYCLVPGIANFQNRVPIQGASEIIPLTRESDEVFFNREFAHTLVPCGLCKIPGTGRFSATRVHR